MFLVYRVNVVPAFGGKAGNAGRCTINVAPFQEIISFLNTSVAVINRVKQPRSFNAFESSRANYSR